MEVTLYQFEALVKDETIKVSILVLMEVTLYQFKCLELEDSKGERFVFVDDTELEQLLLQAKNLVNEGDFYSFYDLYRAFHRRVKEASSPALKDTDLSILQAHVDAIKASVQDLENYVEKLKANYYSDTVTG